MRNRKNNGVDDLIQNLKDYIVPIIGIILILFLIYSFFFSGDGKKTENVENKTGINITFETEDTKAKIYYSGGKNSDAKTNSSLYKGEKIVVSDSRLKLKNNEKYVFNINKLGELKYLTDSHFIIGNGEVWLDSKVALNIDMTYAKVKVSPNSHISFTQNEVFSAIYLISGIAEVSSNSGKSVVLSSKEEIEISKKSVLDDSIDLSIEKKALNELFQNSAWFKLNNGISYLKELKENDNKSSSGSLDDSLLITNDTISFGNLQDESHVSAGSIDIYGNYAGDNITKIIVNNNNNAVLNSENHTFNFDSVDVSRKVNDLVFKVYDGKNNLLDKITYTIYYDAGNNSDFEIKSKKFDVDGSDFVFTAPSSDSTYTSYNDLVTIKGKVTAKNITRVTVNDYQLKSFNGSTWMYHARKDFGNLVDGTNRYEIKYFNGEKLVYTNYYTIVKKTGEDPNKKKTSNGIIVE